MGFSLWGSSGSKTNTTTNEYDYSDGSSNATNGENSDVYNLKDSVGANVSVNSVDAIKIGAALASDGMSTTAKSFNNVVDFTSGAIDRILDAKENDLSAVSNSTFKVLDRGLDFSQDTVAANSKFAKDMTEFYLNQSAKENAANRNMLLDTQQNVVDAWQGATKSTMQLSSDYLGALQNNQESAIFSIMKSSEKAQDATLKAMNGIFESSKSSTERVIDNSLKYIVFGVMALFAIPFLSKGFNK